jgi:hypothetical protein
MSSNGHTNGEMFDIDELRTTATDEVAIVHPVSGQPTTWIWTLAGPGHPASIDVANTAARETLRLQRAREQALVNRKKWVEPERTPDDLRKENAESFARRVLGWTPVKMNGADYSFSHQNVVGLLLDPSFGKIYLQLLEYFSADDSFTKRSVTTSPITQSVSSD